MNFDPGLLEFIAHQSKALSPLRSACALQTTPYLIERC
jgi:hypothetical protein